MSTTTTNPFAYGATDSFQRKSLTAGSYGTSKLAGLKILQFLDKTADGTKEISKIDKNGAMQYKFLVTAIRPSKEQLATVTTDNPADGLDFDGTAFLKLTIHDLWRNAETYALAFSTPETDLVPIFVESGQTTQDAIDTAVAHYRKLATDKLLAANTPDITDEAVQAQYEKEMTQIRIKLGGLMRLMDWMNKGDKSKRDIRFDPRQLAGVEFSGKVDVDEKFGSFIEDSGVFTCKM